MMTVSVLRPQVNGITNNSKGKDKYVGVDKYEKPKAHWTMSNKRLFLDLSLDL